MAKLLSEAPKSDLISIFISGPDVATTLLTMTINQSSTVSQLITKFLEVAPFTITDDDDVILYFAGKPLSATDNLTLEECNILNKSTISYVLRLHGGSSTSNVYNHLDTTLSGGGDEDLCDLPGLVTITNERDGIALDDDPSVKRAKMPCGHVMGVDSMKRYLNDCVFKKNEFRFICPYPKCNAEWPYHAVRHVAMMSLIETKAIEKRMNYNAFNRKAECRQCPGCNSWCQRQDPDNQRTVCLVCSKSNGGRNYEFCWTCMKRWTAGGTNCDNEDCGSTLQIKRLLETCSTKTIYSTSNVPIYRLCPKCNVFIEHKEKCKHMRCPLCATNFCFVCLKLQNNEGLWQCGSYSSVCEVAPRQTM